MIDKKVINKHKLSPKFIEIVRELNRLYAKELLAKVTKP